MNYWEIPKVYQHAILPYSNFFSSNLNVLKILHQYIYILVSVMLKIQLINFTRTFDNSYLTLYTRNTKKCPKIRFFGNNSLLTEYI